MVSKCDNRNNFAFHYKSGFRPLSKWYYTEELENALKTGEIIDSSKWGSVMMGLLPEDVPTLLAK